MTQPERSGGAASDGGYFGQFGGRFVAETLIVALSELERACEQILNTADFQRELNDLLTHYVGRPTPLYSALRLAKKLDPKLMALDPFDHAKLNRQGRLLIRK